jgi:hypothetical protein
MLPHVDEFRPVHNLESLEGLVAALGGAAPGDRRLAGWQTELRRVPGRGDLANGAGPNGVRLAGTGAAGGEQARGAGR